MDYKMNLTQEELDILNGSKGEAMAKVMKTLVMYGDAFGATKMVPVTSKMGHLVTSFGLKVMKPVYDLMDQLIAGGATDSAAFAQAGFRATGITGLNHKLEDYYHTRRDTYDNMNLEGLAGCFAVSVKVLEKFDGGAKQ